MLRQLLSPNKRRTVMKLLSMESCFAGVLWFLGLTARRAGVVTPPRRSLRAKGARMSVCTATSLH